MDENQRAQIRLLLEDVNDVFQRNVDERLKAIYADHSSRGILKSGATIRSGLRSIEQFAGDMVSSSIDRVASVAKDIEAFAILQENAERAFNSLSDRLDGIVSMSTGSSNAVVRQNAAYKAAKTLLSDALTRLRRQLEIHRFTFTQPANSFILPMRSLGMQSATNPTPSKNPGGKPLAAHWDEMWATLAVAIYTGDLQPRTQADIETAIKNWFSENNLEIGDTASRDRARILWKKFSVAQ